MTETVNQQSVHQSQALAIENGATLFPNPMAMAMVCQQGLRMCVRELKRVERTNDVPTGRQAGRQGQGQNKGEGGKTPW